MYRGIDVASQINNTRPSEGEMDIFWLGNASFALRLPESGVILIDPYFSDSLGTAKGWHRLFPPPFDPQAVVPDLAVITHDHLDHLDPATVRQLKCNPSTRFLAPPSCCERLLELGVPNERLTEVRPGDELETPGLRVVIVPAHHLHPLGPRPDAIGVIVRGKGCSLYHSGDTEYVVPVQEAVQAAGGADVALLPINGRLGTMSAADAAVFAGRIDARVVIPMHYGLFKENSGDPYEMVYWLRHFAIETVPVILGYGGSYRYRSVASLDCS